MILHLALQSLILLGQCSGSTPTPLPTHPLHGQINAPSEPTFEWTLSNPDSCQFDFIIRYGLTAGACTTLTNVSSLSQVGTGEQSDFIFRNSNWIFVPVANIYWCVGARYHGSSTYTYSQVRNFQVRPMLASEPTALTITPSSDLSHPNGTTLIQLKAKNGEEGSKGRFYLLNDDGSANQIVSEVAIDDDVEGSFKTTIDLNDWGALTGKTKFSFRAQTVRGDCSVANNCSQASGSATYFYDSSRSLSKPEFLPGAPNEMKWAAVDRANLYRVWKRVGDANCDPSSQICYLNQKPFELYAEINATAGTATYSRAISHPGGTKGSSYFVTAHSLSDTNQIVESSPRSNSVSIGDTSAPQRIDTVQDSQNLRYIPLTSGRDAVAYLCGLSEGGYFNGDNSADLFAKVTAVAATQFDTNGSPICSTANFNAGSEQQNRFDTLSPVFSQLGNLECLKAIQIDNLEPETQYCFKSCLEDLSGNRETPCLISSAKTLSDTEAPQFDGLESVHALESGLGVRVDWHPPTNSTQTDGNYKFVIEYVLTPDLDSTGDFSTTTPLSVETPLTSTSREIPSSDTESDLKTGSRYCFRAFADDGRNRAPTLSVPLCTTLKDNSPMSGGIHIGKADPNEPYRIPLSLKIADREWDGSSSEHISIESLEYQLDNETDWVRVQTTNLFGIDLSNLPAGKTLEAAPSVHFIFNTLAYFAGQRNFRVRVILKKERDSKIYLSNPIYSERVVLFEGMTSKGSFTSRNAVQLCTLNPEAKFNDTSILAIFLGLVGLVFVFRRQKKIFN